MLIIRSGDNTHRTERRMERKFPDSKAHRGPLRFDMRRLGEDDSAPPARIATRAVDGASIATFDRTNFESEFKSCEGSTKSERCVFQVNGACSC